MGLSLIMPRRSWLKTTIFAHPFFATLSSSGDVFIASFVATFTKMFRVVSFLVFVFNIVQSLILSIQLLLDIVEFSLKTKPKSYRCTNNAQNSTKNTLNSCTCEYFNNPIKHFNTLSFMFSHKHHKRNAQGLQGFSRCLAPWAIFKEKNNE